MKDYKADGERAIAQAKEITIITEDDNLVASALGKVYKELIKEIEGVFGPLKKAASESHKKIVAQEKDMLKGPKEATAILKNAILKYEAKQEAIRREKEAELRRQAQAKIQAAEAQALKDGLEIEPPEITPEDIVVQPTIQKQGQTRANWKAEVTDHIAFVNWCVETKRYDYLQPNSVLLTQEAKSRKKESHISGVRFYNEPIKVF